MKTIYAVLFFAFVGMSFGKKFAEEDLTEVHKECIKEVGLEIQDVLDSVNDDFTTTEGNAKINEYTECSFKKLDFIDENNEIKYDALKPIFTPYVQLINNNVVDKDQASNAAVDSCKSVTGDNLGDRIVKFDNCYVRYIINQN